jgi:hypothetical protein
MGMNPDTGEIREFASRVDIPEGWIELREREALQLQKTPPADRVHELERTHINATLDKYKARKARRQAIAQGTEGEGKDMPDREMTPNEIREDELRAIEAWVNLVRETSETKQIRRWLRARIAALRSGQVLSDEVFTDIERQLKDKIDRVTAGGLRYRPDASVGLTEPKSWIEHQGASEPEVSTVDQPDKIDPDAPWRRHNGNALFEELDRRIMEGQLGLRYRQDAVAGMTIDPVTSRFPDETRIIHGWKLDIDLTIPAGRTTYDIPPYQVDQLRAIADGRPSWPDTISHQRKIIISYAIRLLLDEKITLADTEQIRILLSRP